MNDDIEKIEFNNEEEAEVAQINALIMNDNAVHKVRDALAKQALEPSLEECEECGDEIPEARRLAVPGCKLCIYCKEKSERRV
jgi:phage/conjugal plasmid C-4 type zinc finger TraR family protein